MNLGNVIPTLKRTLSLLVALSFVVMLNACGGLPASWDPQAYTVVKGDTLWHIARRYVNNPWRYPELARLSKIKNPDLIYPGQKVIVIINAKKPR